MSLFEHRPRILVAGPVAFAIGVVGLQFVQGDGQNELLAIAAGVGLGLLAAGVLRGRARIVTAVLAMSIGTLAGIDPIDSAFFGLLELYHLAIPLIVAQILAVIRAVKWTYISEPLYGKSDEPWVAEIDRIGSPLWNFLHLPGYAGRPTTFQNDD